MSYVSVLTNHPGWTIEKGWRKLKDRIPGHGNSNPHKENYIAWIQAMEADLSASSIENYFTPNLMLSHILNVILFLSERGLAFRRTSERIGDIHDGISLGIFEFLSKYDPILADHVERVRNTQENNIRFQVHCLSH